MSTPLQVDRLHRVGVVVRSLERATLRYAEIFGMDEWEIREFGPDRLLDVHSAWAIDRRTDLPHGDSNDGASTGVGFFGSTEGTPVTFELVQPLTGESVFQEFRFARGQGISHLALATTMPVEFDDLCRRCADVGVTVISSMTVDRRVRRHFLDTRAMLGGYLVEVNVALDDDLGPAVDEVERWNLVDRYERPTGIGPVPVFGVNHFGIVVDDAIASVGRYHEFFGIEQWTIRDWRTEPGSLENPEYRGQPVDHEYLTGLAPFKDFGFEIIQPTLGPSHYNREFHDVWGEGIHHMLLNIAAGPEDWASQRAWLASIDVPVAISGDLAGGAAAFCYYDTAEALGGYILEGFVIKSMDQMMRVAAAQRSSTDYVIDFAALTRSLD